MGIIWGLILADDNFIPVPSQDIEVEMVPNPVLEVEVYTDTLVVELINE